MYTNDKGVAYDSNGKKIQPYGDWTRTEFWFKNPVHCSQCKVKMLAGTTILLKRLYNEFFAQYCDFCAGTKSVS